MKLANDEAECNCAKYDLLNLISAVEAVASGYISVSVSVNVSVNLLGSRL